MSAEPEEQPYSESNLESPVYRQRLKRKLDCLIAVLEVATAKVRRSLAGPDADVERLQRIEKNLADTLQVCKRAKLALERREKLPEELPFQLDQVVQKSGLDIPPTDAAPSGPKPRSTPQGMVIEMSSAEEYEHFKQLDPIGGDEIASCDLDELCRQLQSE